MLVVAGIAKTVLSTLAGWRIYRGAAMLNAGVAVPAATKPQKICELLRFDKLMKQAENYLGSAI